jgi:hypothetical protein
VQTLQVSPAGRETVENSSARAETCRLDNLLRLPRSKEIS